MVKKLSISISDYVYNQYIAEIITNRSRYIETLIIEGANAIITDKDTIKSKIITSHQKIKELEAEIIKLNFELSKLKQNNSEDDKQKMAVKAIIRSGIIEEE